MLSPLHLDYVIVEGVLRVTSEEVANPVIAKAYSVADLVVPIPNLARPSASLAGKKTQSPARSLRVLP